MTTALTAKEKTTVLAALRYWQRDIADDPAFTFGAEFGEHAPLTVTELDALCDSIAASPCESVPDELHVCRECGSLDVKLDAFVNINDPTDVSTYDYCWCVRCEGEAETVTLREWTLSAMLRGDRRDAELMSTRGPSVHSSNAEVTHG